MAAHTRTVLPVSSSTSLILRRKPTSHSSWSFKLDNLQLNRFLGDRISSRSSNLSILVSKPHRSTVANVSSFSSLPVPNSKAKGASCNGNSPSPSSEHPSITEPAQRTLHTEVEEKPKSGESGEIPRTDWLLGIWPQEESAGHRIMTAHGFDNEKVKALAKNVVTAGTVVLLSVILITVVHPIVVSPAFASFLGTVNAGGPAAAGSKLLKSELLNSAWTGFLAGCLHTLSGPDHLAALAPLSIGRTRIESAVVGALWGCGHDAGQVIFGLLFLLLKDRLHIEIIRTWGTRVVGLTLMVIGGIGIREASEIPAPCVALENGECDVNVYEGLENPTIKKKKIGFATFSTGIVHGLQPDALIVILPALALPSRMAGAAFLFMFLVGTVIAMSGYTVLIGSCSQALKERIPRITEKLTWGASFIAIALGFSIVISQFFGISLY